MARPHRANRFRASALRHKFRKSPPVRAGSPLRAGGSRSSSLEPNRTYCLNDTARQLRARITFISSSSIRPSQRSTTPSRSSSACFSTASSGRYCASAFTSSWSGMVGGMWTSAPAPSMTGPTSASRRCRASCSARRSSWSSGSSSASTRARRYAQLVILRQDAEPLDAVEHDVRSSVFELLGMRDQSGAPDLVDGRLALVFRLVAGLQQDHPDQPVAIQSGREHLPVPRLEDPQRQAHVREQDNVWKGEQREVEGEHGSYRASCRMLDAGCSTLILMRPPVAIVTIERSHSTSGIRHPHPSSGIRHPQSVSERSASSCPRNPSTHTARACGVS